LTKAKLLVTAPELAEKLSVCERTINNWVKMGIIPSLKIGRNRLFNPIKVLNALEEEFLEVRIILV